MGDARTRSRQRGQVGLTQWSRPDEFMARLLFAFLLFVTVFAQSTFIPRLNPLPVTPDLVLIMLFLWAGFHSVRESLFWIFVTGIVLDVISIDPLGAHPLALVAIVALSHPIRIRPMLFNVISGMLLVFLATVIHGVILYIVRGIPPTVELGLQAVLNALLVPVFMLALRLLGR